MEHSRLIDKLCKRVHIRGMGKAKSSSIKGKTPHKRGLPEYVPNDKDRNTVEAMAVIGIAEACIANAIKVGLTTLRKYYPEELAYSAMRATAQVGGALFKKAMGGDTAAMIFWMKTRAQWRETNRTELTGANGGPITTQALPTRESDAAKIAMFKEFLSQYNQGVEYVGTGHERIAHSQIAGTAQDSQTTEH